MIYGPSAATGLAATAAVGTGFMFGLPPVFLILAAFTLIGAALALFRIIPKKTGK